MIKSQIFIFALFITCASANSTEFVKGYIEFLNILSGLNSVGEATTPNNNDESILDLFKQISQSKNIWILADNKLKKISKHAQDENEKTVLEALTNIVAVTVKNYDNQQKLMEDFINSKGNDPGTLYKRYGEALATMEEMGQLLLQTTVLFTHVLVDSNPDKEGKLSFLILSTEQRNGFKKSLALHFGEEIKKGMQAGMNRIPACAAAIYQILNGHHISQELRN